MREVSENLKDKKLTLDDFTFFKEPLGLDDPEKEIIREAKLKAAGGGTAPPKKTATPKTPRTKVAANTKASSPTLKAANAAAETSPQPAPATDSPKPKSTTKTINSFKVRSVKNNLSCTYIKKIFIRFGFELLHMQYNERHMECYLFVSNM